MQIISIYPFEEVNFNFKYICFVCSYTEPLLQFVPCLEIINNRNLDIQLDWLNLPGEELSLSHGQRLKVLKLVRFHLIIKIKIKQRIVIYSMLWFIPWWNLALKGHFGIKEKITVRSFFWFWKFSGITFGFRNISPPIYLLIIYFL